MVNQQFQSVIDACNTCATACDFCAMSCLQESDPKPMVRCIALDMDCAEICRTTAAWLSRNSEFSGMVSQTCADMCDACAEECSKFRMRHCQECAQACRQCADECRRISSIKPTRQMGTGAGRAAH